MNKRISAFLALGIILVASNSWPHHNMTALFDLNDRVTLTGTFTKMDWRNPHIQFFVESKNDKGQVETWSVEGPPPSFFRTRDITRADFRRRPRQDRNGRSQPRPRPLHLGVAQSPDLAGREGNIGLSAELLTSAAASSLPAELPGMHATWGWSVRGIRRTSETTENFHGYADGCLVRRLTSGPSTKSAR